jgi:two-component system nitrate/nitrite response regulator NarL
VSKICLISDQPVLLSGFAQVLEERDFDVSSFTTESLHAAGKAKADRALSGGALSGGALFQKESSVSADLALLDATAGLAFDVLADLNATLPGCPVVLWSDEMPLEQVFKTLEYGVRGLIPRTSKPDFLVNSLTKVANGEMQIGFAAARYNAPMKRAVTLTPREREIVMRLRRGLRNKEIAAEMNITEGTVKIYLFRLFHKMGVRNRFELASYGGLDNPQFTPTAAEREAQAQRTEAADH